MATCEKCWRDAAWRVMHLGGSQVERYAQLLKEREATPCTPEQQRDPEYDADLRQAVDR